MNLAKCSIFIIVDSDLIKEQKRKDLLGLLGAMENTMEYTVSVYYVVAIVPNSSLYPGFNFAIDYASILTLSNATYFLRVLRLAPSGVASPTIWSRYANFNSSLFISLEIDCVD